MPQPTIDLDSLAEEDQRRAVEMLGVLHGLDEQVAEASESLKELRKARKDHYAKLMAFVEDCKAGEPPLMKGV